MLTGCSRRERDQGLNFAVARYTSAPVASRASFGRRYANSNIRAERSATGTAASLEQEAVGVQVPSVRAIAAQSLALLAAIGGVMAATVSGKAALQGVVGLAGLYVIMSVNEYCVHRYYQHLGLNKTVIFRWLRNKFNWGNLKTTGHVEHHKETLDDMSLNMQPDPILDNDPFRGTAFSWSVSMVMTIEIAIQSYPWLWLCGWSLQASTLALAAAMSLHAAVWQTLHPWMHELADPPVKYGVPGWSLKWVRHSGYFRFLYANHEGHHRAPGSHGNYNVCCPLADHMFGTYVGIIPAKQAQVA